MTPRGLLHLLCIVKTEWLFLSASVCCMSAAYLLSPCVTYLTVEDEELGSPHWLGRPAKQFYLGFALKLPDFV